MPAKLLFLGAPGVGKGTFAKRVAPALGIAHLSAGECLRENVRSQSYLGRFAESYLVKGDLVPSALVIDMMKSRISDLRKRPDFRGYLLDGFPRVVEQAQLWESIGDGNPTTIVNITLNEDVLIKKLSYRRVCGDCGDNYNLADIRNGHFDMPPMLPKTPGVCDKCNGNLIQRSDDSDEVVRKRINSHFQTESALLEFYRAQKIKMIDFAVTRGVSQTPDLLTLLQ
jgi:adenylate kinase